MGQGEMAMSPLHDQRAAEWRAHWPLVLTAFVGLSLTSVIINSTGLVIAPIEREFGWSRTEVTVGTSLATLLAIPLSPFVGALIDRFGVRKLGLPGTVLASLGIAGIALADGSSTQWLALWIFYGLAALFIKATIWTAAVTGAFTAGRSLAISVILCGTAFASIACPPLMQFVTDNYGWREGYLAIAVLWGVPAFVLSWFFLYDAHDQKAGGASAISAVSPPDMQGLSVSEAARSFTLWRIGLATLIMLLLASCLLVHQVPMLNEFGVSRAKAAWLVSLTGVAAVAGKLVTGWMMERWDASLVGSATNFATALALVLLLEPFRAPATIVTSIMVVGYAGGTKLQLCVYLTGIYAGMRNYGKIFGVMASIVAVAGGVGPVVGGAIYDTFGGYDALIMMAIPASMISALLILRLGEYPEWSKSLESGASKPAVAV
jgi:predicted MFS family arabinose efflux permease